MSGPSQATAGRPFGLIRQGRRSRRQLLRYSLTGLRARALRCSCASLISTPLPLSERALHQGDVDPDVELVRRLVEDADLPEAERLVERLAAAVVGGDL